MEYGIAIDIGTTTLVMDLININNKVVINNYTSLNKQRKFGKSVIDRIRAASEGKDHILRQIIINEILAGIEDLTKDIDKINIKELVIGCNTSMSHILLGFPCNSLGLYPYKPYDISHIIKPFKKVFDSNLLNIDVNILPGISAYVGGDILAGLYYADFHKSKDINILIDLGTNGEMAIGNKNKIYVTSTAVGPAFEKSNINYGVKAIDLVADLLNDKIIDETGLLIDEFFDTGYILDNENRLKFTQKDIRDIQLAKAAVRAGIEILIKSYSVKDKDINKLFISGNFGYHLNIEKAVAIGLIPKAFSDKIVILGNTVLKGVGKFMINKSDKESLDKIKKISNEIILSNEEDFNDLYINCMNF